MASITIMIVIATVAVMMRCMARRISNLKFGLDDWLIMLALVWSYGVTITQYIGKPLLLAWEFSFGKTY